ncbi:UvrD-helicase domain-containing protein [Flavobacterium sp.]|uniref:UvrD-helicase domain-containing protein n=1 Tax=Flavobacterium sp. TaxID=239 RepID=UPI0039E6B841
MAKLQTPSFSIYDASAGSGKTRALVKEYLKIILVSKKDDAYRNILAITFTNKAVHEMKSRIVGSLSEFAKDDPDGKAQQLMQDIHVETGLSLPEIKQKAKNIIRHIIHNYAAFDISTIDKFTHRVIRAFAHDLNLPMTFEVSLDTENLLIEAVDAIIAQAGEDPELTQLLIDFTMEKTDDDKSWDVSREILDTGRLVLNENHRNEIVHFQQKSIAEFIAIKNKLTEAVAALDQQNKELAELALQMIDQNGIDPKSFSRGTFPNHLGYILNNELKSSHKRFYEFDDIAINKTAADRALIENLIPEWLSILQSVYRNYEKRDFYRAFLKNITPLSLLNTVSNELVKIQQEQNILSISEFNAIIHREIQNQPAPFIYERLGERYRHFFIDEFQDTSEMQWQNLIPLIDNALAGQDDFGQKGTLMIVGDPKQSIYRWRGGKAEQFIALSKDHNPFHNPEKQNFSLGKNWRSYSEVVSFNNQFFAQLASRFEQADYRNLYENHSAQEVNDKTGGYVNITFLAKQQAEATDEDPLDKTQQYVRATLETIEKARRDGFEYKDIVVLVRHNKNGIAVANYLTEQNIPLQSSETLMIQNATEVRVMVALLRYLKNNADLEAKALFLQYIGEYVQDQMPVHDFIAAGMEHRDETEFEVWLAAATGNSSFLTFQEMRKKSLYESVELLVSRFIQSEKSNAYVQYFLDIVLERDMRGQAGIPDFLEFWDKKSDSFSIPSPEGNDAVRIISIHKSKGLEFPVVILPFADENYSRQRKDRLWLDAEESEFGISKVLIDNSKAVEDFGEHAAVIYRQKKQEELLDNINVLYVALTRAEEQLYVISEAVEPNKSGEYPESTATFFIEFLMAKGLYQENQLTYTFGNPQRLSVKHDLAIGTKTIPVVAQTLDPASIKIARSEALMWGTHQQEAIAYGNVVHEILSFIHTPNDIEQALERAAENGLITVLQKDAVRETISEIVGHSALAPYFAADNTVWNEQSIIQKQRGTVKPDRMVLTPGNQVLLLDYKTGQHQHKYQHQLEGYQQAIEEMGYEVAKKVLVYIGETVKIIPL